MKKKLALPLAICLFTMACGQSSPQDVDAATSQLINALDKKSPGAVSDALSLGARADAQAAFGNTALHFASSVGDASLTHQILSYLLVQTQSKSDLVNAITKANKDSQSALEIAARQGNRAVVDSFASFCKDNKILRPVFFPVTKKLAAEEVDGLDLVVNAVLHYGAANKHMAHLILETIGTKEGQAIIHAQEPDSLIQDFAQAYVLALEANQETQDAFFKVASGFRIEKRTELIQLMSSICTMDLYRNFDRAIRELSAKFGVDISQPKIVRQGPGKEPSSNSNPKSNTSKREHKETDVDYNALLRDAVTHNESDAILYALENGARLDALDTNLQNVFHLAAESNASAALTTLLSQLQCSNAQVVLLQKDANGFTPYALSAHLEDNKKASLRAFSDFLMSSNACQKIAKTEIREWAKAGDDVAIRAAYWVLSEINKGTEVISSITYMLLGGTQADNAVTWVQESVAKDARDHIYARMYFSAISKSDDLRKTKVRAVVNRLSEVERRQIVGFMLFLSSGQSDKATKEYILSEVESLGLPKAMFEGSSDNVAELKAALDEKVTGQENAKISLAVAVRNHYDRVAKGLKKSNVLILGPSGTGKTFLVETIAKTLDVPFSVFDATNITQAGYVGGKASDAVVALAERGGYDKERIEKGIIFLDEIDKMASRSGRSESDEFKRQGQASLLKMLEGIDVEIQVSRFDTLNISTENILFVCAGAFTGLPEIIEKRLNAEGLNMSDNPFDQVTAADLIKYGMAPEFLGRLPNVITLRHLSADDMVAILKNPKASVLEEYRELFLARGIEIKFTDGALQAMAERAVTYNVGARALRTVAESVMSDLQFRISHMGLLKTITITERTVRFGDMPKLEYKSSDE